MFTDIICSLSSIGRMRHIIPIWLKRHCFNRLKVTTTGYWGNGCNRFLTKWMAWIHCWPMTWTHWTLPNASPKKHRKVHRWTMAPKISSPYANSKDPNVGMHEADANMSINRARFHQVNLSPQVMQGAKKELAETCPENMVVWTEPVDHGCTAVSGCIGCWDDVLDGSCCWRMIERMNIVTLRSSFGGKSNSTHFFHRSIVNSLKRYTYSIESTRSSVTDIYKPQKVAWPVAYATSKTACRITSHRVSTTQRLRLGQLKTTKLPTSPLINAGCSGVRPQYVWTNLVLKKITSQWITARWMHYYW